MEQLLGTGTDHKFRRCRCRFRLGRHFKRDRFRTLVSRVGDSLEKIAKRFNISVKTLKSNNNLTGPTIRAGSRLVIAN